MSSAVDGLVESRGLAGVGDEYLFINEETTEDAGSGMDGSVANLTAAAAGYGSPVDDILVTHHPNNSLQRSLCQELDQVSTTVILPAGKDVSADEGVTDGLNHTLTGNSGHFQTNGLNRQSNLEDEKFKGASDINVRDNDTVPIALVATLPRKDVAEPSNLAVSSQDDNTHLEPRLSPPSSTHVITQLNFQNNYEAEEPSVVSLCSHSGTRDKPDMTPDPEANSTVTPISTDDNATHSIYVNGDFAHQRNLKPTSIYLNAEGENRPPNVAFHDRLGPVSIKISPDSNESDFLELDDISVNNEFGRFVEEVHNCLGDTVKCVGERTSEDCDFGELENNDGGNDDVDADDEAVLHVEAIHCDILDEFFDGISKNECKVIPELLVTTRISDDTRCDGRVKNDVDKEKYLTVCSPEQKQGTVISEITLTRAPSDDGFETDQNSNLVVPARTLTLECINTGKESTVKCETLGKPNLEGWEGEGDLVVCEESISVGLEGTLVPMGGCADHSIDMGAAGETVEGQDDHANVRDSRQSHGAVMDDLSGCEIGASINPGVMGPSSVDLSDLTSMPPPSVCGDGEEYNSLEVMAVGGQSDMSCHGCADSANNGVEQTVDKGDANEDHNRTGLAAAMSRVVRRSMRRMRRLRLSGGRGSSGDPGQRGKKDGVGDECMSEETEVRRVLPAAPALGLSTVRSPAAASIIVTSLMAALSPPPTPIHPPREVLDPPPIDNPRRSDDEESEEEGGREGGNCPSGSQHQRSSGEAWQTAAVAVIPRASLGPSSSSNSSSSSRRGQEGQATGTRRRSRHHHSNTNNTGTLNTTTSAPIISSSDEEIGFNSTEVQDRSGSAPEVHDISSITDVRNRSSSAPDVHNRSGVTEVHNRRSSAADVSNRRSVTEVSNRRSVTEVSNRRNVNEVNDGSSSATEVHSRSSVTEVHSRSSGTLEGNSNSNDNTRIANSSERNSRSRGNRNINGGRHAHTGGEVEHAVRGATWRHSYSGLLASLAVTVTTFNISRFAVLGARFGWPFLVQWVVVSVAVGLPLMTFHSTVGQYLGAGVVDMWRISPIFQGVGYSLLVTQALVGLYCCVPIAWLFIFFRDSFITHNNMFRWADCRLVNCSVYNNFSTIIIEGVPKYFNSQVLQRGDGESSWLQELGSLKFDMAFNIALIWLITLTALSRGNQTYGKVCYIVFLLPLVCFLMVSLYLTSWTKDDLYINDVTKFNELFMNSHSWMAASREVFLVWGFHGAVLQQMAAHNKRGHALYRDTTILSVITTLVLVLAAVTGSTCVSGLHKNNLHYKPSSFENTETAQFLSESKIHHKKTLLKLLHLGNVPPHFLAEYMYHDNFYAGIRIRPPKLGNEERTAEDQSGYQSLRLATELFPALLAVNGAQQISPFWSSLFYLSLLLFGIAQQLAVWRTVVEAVIHINFERLQAWETFITFLCCLFGFSAALPMATGAGIKILYFFDYVVSCGWWLMIIQLVQIFALLFVRGKPYSGQDIVGELMGKKEQCRSLWLGPLTSFAWNIIVPVGLLVLSIASFKSGQYREVFAWGSDSYWPTWVCQLASALQLFPILLVPLMGLVQTCRYLAATDDDLFERIQRLYRPSLRERTNGNDSFYSGTEESDLDGGITDGQEESGTTLTPLPYSDPPPKYTPPPSYSTATGVRFAKLLNRSLRQSMRRLRVALRNSAENNTNTEETSDANECGQSSTSATAATPYIPPPDYVVTVTECGADRHQNSTLDDSPPQYSTLDPLRRQQALAALADPTLSSVCVKSNGETEPPLPTTPVFHRDNSLSRSGLSRSIASGVRRSARHLAVTLRVGGDEDGTTLVNSETPVSQDNQLGQEVLEPHPYAYTNFELVSHSDA